MAYQFDLWGWYAGMVDAGAPRSTDDVPPTLSTATTVGSPRANWSGQAWQVRPFETPPPAPSLTPVPLSVTKRQARQALILAGLIDAVQPAIDAIENPVQRALMQSEWDDSQVFERHRPSLLQMATAIGLDSEELDTLFRTAGAL